MRAGGMAPFAAPRATADVAAQKPVRSAAGVSARRRRRGPKGQRKAASAPARHGPLVGQPVSGGSYAARHSAPPSRGALSWAAVSPVRRAERALEVVCRADPHRADGPSGSLAAVKRAQVVVTYGRLAVASGPGCRRLPRLGVAWDGHVPEDRGQLVRKPEFGVYVTCRNPLLRAGRVRSPQR